MAVLTTPWRCGADELSRHVLDGGGRVRLEVVEMGAAVVALWVQPDAGAPLDVVLGYADPLGYTSSVTYFGAVVGRYANRIGGGRFSLDGQAHRLTTNQGPHTLHGGTDGFDCRAWSTTDVGAAEVTLALVSPDGDQGFPGRLQAQVRYEVAGDEVSITYRASTDRPTVVNLTNHSYFNLAGEASGPVGDHLLQVDADLFTPTDADSIPLGPVEPVDGTVFDLRTPTRLGPRLATPDSHLAAAGGIDHNLVVRGEGLRQHAVLTSEASGLGLTVSSDQPGVQVYTGNFLDGSVVGKGGRPYGHRAGLCLETQHFPDSPHHSDYPSTVLRPGDELVTRTVWRFHPA